MLRTLSRLLARESLAQLIRHSRRRRLVGLGLRLAGAERIGHLRPFNLGIHGQEQFGHRRAPSQVRRPSQPAGGDRVEPVDVAAVLDSTYAAAGFSFPASGPFGLYSATR